MEQSSEERYKALLSNINACVVVHGPDTKIILSNPRASEILGLSEDQMAGRSAIDPHWRFVDLKAQPIPIDDFPVNRILRSKSVLKDLILGIVKDVKAEVDWAIVNGLPVFNADNTVKEIVISFVDITALRNAEAKLQKSLEEKTMLLKEVNHRIKNNILNIEGMLTLQLENANHEETKDALKDSISRVQSMRVLYEMLTGSVDRNKRLSIQEYLKSLVKNVTDPYPQSESIRIDQQIEDILLESEMVFTIGMIVNELITNSMKYAFNETDKGEISISVAKENDKFKLVYQDNGPGLPADLNSNKSSGLGLMLINVLSQTLGAELMFTNENGAKTELEFELEKLA